MIKIVESPNYVVRANGWVQDASSFPNLRRFVSAFVPDCEYFKTITANISEKVEERDGRSRLLDILKTRPIAIGYKDIVGTTFRPRSASRCNGIGQAALPGQSRWFQIDWPTDNFLRWAVVLQFVSFDMTKDEYSATDAGRSFALAETDEDAIKIYEKQLSFYPPAKRILELLEEGPKTKFGLGQKLGFIGEEGFTSVSDAAFLERYRYSYGDERRKLAENFEGSSDKYARQICSWLALSGFVSSTRIPFDAGDGTEISLGVYSITPKGKNFLRDIRIQNDFFVPFGMLSMESKNPEKHKKRRALILKDLTEGGRESISQIVGYCSANGIATDPYEIADDIDSLFSCGLDIQREGDIVWTKNNIIGLEIPSRVALSTPAVVESIKAELRGKLKHIDHRLLNLIDYSVDGRDSSRLFETYIWEVYSLIFPKSAILLGGSNKPDVVISDNDTGIIIDAKAYGGGFDASKSETDKMVRYITDAQTKKDNPTHWWDSFSGSVSKYVFQWASSSFTLGVKPKVDYINQRTGVDGSYISAKNLLLFVDDCISKGVVDHSKFSSNKEIEA